jgi:hypothetical protein
MHLYHHNACIKYKCYGYTKVGRVPRAPTDTKLQKTIVHKSLNFGCKTAFRTHCISNTIRTPTCFSLKIEQFVYPQAFFAFGIFSLKIREFYFETRLYTVS